MKKYFNLRVFLTTFIISMLGILFFLSYQQNYQLLGWLNSFSVVTVFIFAGGFFALISSEGVFDMLTYGTKYFLKAVVGKKMKKTYLETRLSRTKTDKAVYLSIWLVGLVFLAVTISLYMVYYS